MYKASLILTVKLVNQIRTFKVRERNRTLVMASSSIPQCSSSRTILTWPSLDARCNPFSPFWRRKQNFSCIIGNKYRTVEEDYCHIFQFWLFSQNSVRLLRFMFLRDKNYILSLKRTILRTSWEELSPHDITVLFIHSKSWRLSESLIILLINRIIRISVHIKSNISEDIWNPVSDHVKLHQVSEFILTVHSYHLTTH